MKKELPTDPIISDYNNNSAGNSTTNHNSTDEKNSKVKMPLKEKLFNTFVIVFLSFTMILCIYQINDFLQPGNMEMTKVPFLDMLILVVCFKYLRVYIKKFHELIHWHGFKHLWRKIRKKDV